MDDPSTSHATISHLIEALKAIPDRTHHMIAGAAREVCYADHVVCTGVGKSSFIAMKLAATFRSYGRPATFIHATDASHGDLGILRKKTVVIAVSNSGETAELVDVLNYALRHELCIIGIVGDMDSTLGRRSLAIPYGKPAEACPIGVAPTTSTSLALAVSDALATTVARLLGVSEETFAAYHPAGSLGRELTPVREIMTEDLPLVDHSMPTPKAVKQMKPGIPGVLLVTRDGIIRGVVTDGDLRRNVNRLATSKVGDIMTYSPFRVADTCSVKDAIAVMNEHRVTCLLVEDVYGLTVGIVHLHDCLSGKKAR